MALLTRRRFLLGVVVVAGGGLALSWATRRRDSLAETADTLEPNAFLQLRTDGVAVFQLDKLEMGQGTMTGLLTLVAEELDLDPARFEVRFAPVRRTFARPLQMTGQSRSMADSWDVLRETGAAARAMLIQAAAQRWDVDSGEIRTDNGLLRHVPSGRETSYAAVTAAAARLSVPRRVSLRPAEQYRWIGTAVPRVDIPAKVTGAAVYGIDVRPPGMLTAVIARVPQPGARLTGADTSVAAAMAGVRGCVELPHGIAVVAEHFWAARKAAAQIKLQWTPGPLAGRDSAALLRDHRAQLERDDPDYSHASGDTGAALAAAATVIEAEYRVPYLAHAAMEPLNATVHVGEGRCDVWVPSQTPDMARNIVAELTGMPREAVHVHVTFAGGGFGRRFLWDFVLEATLIAREFDVPVQTVWTREDDIRHGYYRQQTVHRLRGGLDAGGNARAWEHRQVATPTARVVMGPVLRTLLPEVLSPATRRAVGEWSGEVSADLLGAFQAREGAETLAYDMPAHSLLQYAHDPGVPVSIWRSVGSSYNGFVVESFIDELAVAAGADPAAYRRARLHQPRHLAVFDRLLELSAWGRPATGRAQGIAFFESFETVVGQVAEVSVSNGHVRVHHVYCVVECGRAVTPDIVRQQMEGGIIFGLTAALYGEITFADGQVEQSNFHDYRLLGMADAPAITVEVLPSERPPTGVGEPGVPPVAAAVANAVYAATGERLRTLPLRPAGG